MNYACNLHEPLHLDASTVADMQEGKKLEALLEERNIKKADFARACKVGPSAVQHMIKAVEWKPAMWATIAAGLEKLDVDAGLLRKSTTAFRERPAADLRPLVDKIPAASLTALRDLVSAPDAERQRVLDYLDGLLKGQPSK